MGRIVKFPGRGTKPITDLSGRRFGRLSVLWPAGYGPCYSVTWLCQCSCLNFTLVNTASLMSGHTKSCGCFEIDNRFIVNRKHGHSSQANGMTPELRCYFHARSRCQNRNDRSYPKYGGRGIKFLFTSFPQFLNELGLRPEGHSIDRIDNEGHYEPGNVRWATMKEQRTNQRPITPHHRRPASDETRRRMSEAKRARLDESKVREIRALGASGVPSSTIATDFHTSIQHVHAILRRHVWKDVA